MISPFGATRIPPTTSTSVEASVQSDIRMDSEKHAADAGDRRLASSVALVPSLKQYPAITHFIAFTCLLLPIAFAPYLTVRGQVRGLRREVQRLTHESTRLNQELTILERRSVTWKEHTEGRHLLDRTISDLRDLRSQVQCDKDSSKHYESRVRDVSSTISAIQDRSRAHEDILRSLGASLADVAQFMHRVDLITLTDEDDASKQSLDRLRSLAASMHNLSSHDNKASPPS
ncbi:hypothetical protein FISHEDRAFT_76076 [Fistulina hepatica ATCC 64428]|uniref:Uncharacterized protein n=1 Tax=Fistulina hepatica ATCC 64428 TaxID=1128425 RepID=A0A0D7A7F2_9AGAR|nr:hypothetical protein FISHEDRAFT_76076 [Fistulina hepatica ATCC 64428]